MTTITLDGIKNNVLQKRAKNIAVEVNKQINGRVCLTSYVHNLYVIKQMLGDFCKTYLEIGTLHGGTIGIVSQSKYPTKFIGVDVFNFYGKPEDHCAKPPIKVSRQNAINNINKVNSYRHPFHLIEGDSQNKTTVEEVKNIAIQFKCYSSTAITQKKE